MDYTELKRKGRKLLEAGELEKCYQMFEEALRYPGSWAGCLDIIEYSLILLCKKVVTFVERVTK